MASFAGAVAPRRRRRTRAQVSADAVATAAAILLLSTLPSGTAAQDAKCVSLKGSKACPAFQSASVAVGDKQLLAH